MELLVIFTSEEEGTEEILKILADNGVDKGVAIESQGMKKVLGYTLSPQEIFAVFADRRPFNRTIMVIIEKENVRKMMESINNYWKTDKDKERKKHRVMFSVPINNLKVGI
jgi:RAB protein geranylgeranyltransferase component A